jgi:4-diphosphocytidyl-2-C-methyl-D-erythritol kinase
MTLYEAPAKLNLSLLVSPPRADGFHPLASLVQTVEWCDLLTVERGEGRDELESEIEDNLVSRAVVLAREFGDVPALWMSLEKSIPVAAGLGGGSSDAAAALVAASNFGDVHHSELSDIASRVGSDVALFLVGGTMLLSGRGEQIAIVEPADEFAVAIVVPEFGLATAEVYRAWDDLEGPEGVAMTEGLLPPSLRGRMPMRNDLLPAALAVEPLLGDFMADVTSVWATTVCLTGSGSACFGYFPTVEEASDAVGAVSHLIGTGRGVSRRDLGVARVPQERS